NSPHAQLPPTTATPKLSNHHANGLSFNVPIMGDPGTTPLPYELSNGITVILQRLANPYIPFEKDQTSPMYNPYITVDYIENVPVNNAEWAQWNGKGVRPKDDHTSKAFYSSVGKKQPY